MFWWQIRKMPDPAISDDVKVTGAGVVSIDSAKLIRHPKAQRQIAAFRKMNLVNKPKDKSMHQTQNIGDYFPEIIRRLPKFEGQFPANKLTAEGCDVLFGAYPAGTEIPAHSHDTENVGVITKGRLLLDMDGETREYGPGDWYRIPAGREHAARFPEATADIEFWFQP